MSFTVGVLVAVTVALLMRPGARAIAPAVSLRHVRAGPALVALMAFGGATLWWVLDGTQLVLGLIVLAVGGGVGRLVARSRREAAAVRRADQVLALCESMASDLAAGQPPLVTLDRAASEWSEFTPVATAGRLGADVPTALRQLAEQPGGGALRVLAAAWQVAHRSGSGLAAAVAQASDAMREERATMRLVAAELSSAHATARMMTVLPFAILLLGSGVGGDPVGFLTATPAGLGCLAAGLGLCCLGLVWLQRIADRVLEP